MANATSLANRIEAIFDEEEPEQDWLEHRVIPDFFKVKVTGSIPAKASVSNKPSLFRVRQKLTFTYLATYRIYVVVQTYNFSQRLGGAMISFKCLFVTSLLLAQMPGQSRHFQ